MGYAVDRQHDASTNALGGNVPYRGLEWHSTAKPDYLIYVFSCSQRTFCDPGDVRKGIIGRIKLLAPGIMSDDPNDVTVKTVVEGKPVYKVSPGQENQPYHYVTSFPQPILIPKFNDESGEIETKETDVRRFVVDMISPDNLTMTLDTVVDPAKAFSIGNDYAPKGIFFSYHNPPLREDLQKAYLRMEAYYKGLNERAATLDLTDKLGLQNALASNPDHVYAANYYGKDFAWARKAVRPVECPVCGEQKPAGRLFHTPSTGGICVEQSEKAWKLVVNSGRLPYESVPEDFRWKKEAKKD